MKLSSKRPKADDKKGIANSRPLQKKVKYQYWSANTVQTFEGTNAVISDRDLTQADAAFIKASCRENFIFRELSPQSLNEIMHKLQHYAY